MKLDVDTLGTFYEMAREGAGLAANRLSSMTDIPARVDVTHLNFTRDASIARELTDTEWVGIRVRLSDGFGGTSVLLFDRESAETIAAAVIDDIPTVEDGTLHDSTVTEIAQIMNNGFVDGWANVLDTNIDVSAPTYVSADTPDEFLADSALSLADEQSPEDEGSVGVPATSWRCCSATTSKRWVSDSPSDTTSFPTPTRSSACSGRGARSAPSSSRNWSGSTASPSAGRRRWRTT
ncbi:chemotaxis protein CheC [Halorussus sp. MSC15.2]|uniref:chemotaxis protein CheC n=1 Tax=Halorussus sp. MSC15.2 TaxID=2283638 RepID=UPI001F080C80|nr:chemotaxis protein CheC [Halorussus sp. MSC15.2]